MGKGKVEKQPKEKKVKGVNFYRDESKVKRVNLLRGGKPKRDHRGKIVKAAEFANSKPDQRVARIAPNIKWFGNTRVIGQTQLDQFRDAMTEKTNDPFQVLLHTNKLPMSLLTDSKQHSKMNLLETESFNYVFGKTSQRKRPKISSSSLEDLSQAAQQRQDSYQPEKDSNLVVDSTNGEVDEKRDRIFEKGQSKRIWGELFKVIDSSDVIVHLLDARNPLGTRCRNVEEYVRNNAPHKHLIFLLNKCDLIPVSMASKWVKILSKERPTLAFHASITNPFGKGSLINLFRQYSKLHADKKQISVGFIGYPNTGKSSVINALRKKAVCSVAPIPGQTKIWQYVTLMKRIYLIDCPGVVPTATEDSETEIVLKGVVRIENIKNPEEHIQAILDKVKPEYIIKTYDIVEWTDSLDFLEKFARKSGKLLKGGEPDISTSAKMVLNDWLRGRIPFCIPPPALDNEKDEQSDK